MGDNSYIGINKAVNWYALSCVIMRSIFLCKNCSSQLFGEKGEAITGKGQNLERNLDLLTLTMLKGQGGQW